MSERLQFLQAMWLPLDEGDQQIARIVRQARREAADVPEAPSPKLVALVRCVSGDSDILARLAVVVMIRHPDQRAVATGAGAVWAVASRLVNEAAGVVLGEQPLFQVLP